MVKKEFITHKNYGNCVRLSNDVIEAVATVDFGPRIIHFSFEGGENVLNTKKDELGAMGGKEFDEFFYKGAAWRNYGGHRLWASPEKLPETYYPDCNKVEYEFTASGVILTPPPQNETGLAMQIELKMSDSEPKMDVIHNMTNISGDRIDKSLWALSVCAQGGTLIIPMNTNDTGLLPNRVISVWPYTDLSDERLHMGKKYVTIKQNPDAKSALKLGFDLNDGKMYYVLGNSVFCKKYYPNHPKGCYPDGGVSTEVYTNDLIIELETLSTQEIMLPGGTNTHLESWSLLQKPHELDEKDEASIESFVSKL